MNVSNKFFIGLMLGVIGISSYAAEPDWSNYDLLLKHHVAPINKAGISISGVDYLGLKTDPLYLQTVTEIQKFDVNTLNTPAEKLAFYINAYNIFAIKMVVDHWPLESIKDAGSLFGSVWKKDIGRINNRDVSLDQIEHDILRKLREPRIHMAIVCASISCPDLRNEAYTAEKLDKQLDEQAQLFLMNAAKGLKASGNKLTVSKIFDWFEDDFDVYGGVLGFMKKYRKDLSGNITIDSYLPYNWQLNAQN